MNGLREELRKLRVKNPRLLEELNTTRMAAIGFAPILASLSPRGRRTYAEVTADDCLDDRGG